ncbi:MAG: hypothetical protein WD100_02420 [Tistlia sp.]|uniref:hypothetical protein n=1 Tax=Tistlia sp. TaxID=3057121 RepID=UPI0034A2807A
MTKAQSVGPWARLAALLLAIFAIAVLAAPGEAQLLCNKPLQPLCSMEGQQFADDEMARTRCRDDVRTYIAELDTFETCLTKAATEAEEAREDARRFLSCLESEDIGNCSLEADPGT